MISFCHRICASAWSPLQEIDRQTNSGRYLLHKHSHMCMCVCMCMCKLCAAVRQVCAMQPAPTQSIWHLPHEYPFLCHSVFQRVHLFSLARSLPASCQHLIQIALIYCILLFLAIFFFSFFSALLLPDFFFVFAILGECLYFVFLMHLCQFVVVKWSVIGNAIIFVTRFIGSVIKLLGVLFAFAFALIVAI